MISKILCNGAALQTKCVVTYLHIKAFPGEPYNILMNSAHLLLSKDMVKLYSCYNDAMTNLVGTFLNQDKKFCREALPAYKKFLNQVDKIHNFLELSEVIFKICCFNFQNFIAFKMNNYSIFSS